MVSYLVAVYTHGLVFTGLQICSLLASRWNPVILPNIRITVGSPVALERMKLSQLRVNRQADRKVQKGKVRFCHW